jgi:hypothetical protein
MTTILCITFIQLCCIYLSAPRNNATQQRHATTPRNTQHATRNTQHTILNNTHTRHAAHNIHPKATSIFTLSFIIITTRLNQHKPTLHHTSHLSHKQDRSSSAHAPRNAAPHAIAHHAAPSTQHIARNHHANKLHMKMTILRYLTREQFYLVAVNLVTNKGKLMV